MKKCSPLVTNVRLLLVKSIRYLAYSVLLATLAIATKADPTATQAAPRILAGPDTQILVCWFVESDGKGHHGYAAQDGRLDSISPEGGGLFPTLTAFDQAIASVAIQSLSDWQHPARSRTRPELVSDAYPGNVPQGWKIRALTPAELKTLRGH